MRTKEFVGIFHSVDQAIQKVENLKAQGYSADEILAFGRNEADMVFLQEQTGIGLLDNADRGSFDTVDMETDGISLVVNSIQGNGKVEMDGQSEQSASGELLNGQSEEQQVTDGPDTLPRLNTRNL